MKKIYFFLVMVLGVSGVWGQTNPTAFDLSTGNWAFAGWSNAVPAGSYPGNGATGANATTGVVVGAANANMSFWTYSGDQVLTATAAGNYSAVYTAASAHFVGNGTNGLYFDNTGGAGVGSAILSINTNARSTITVGWTAKTIATGARQYGIRLQYRIGTTGAFTDASSTVANILYTGGTAGTSQTMTTVTLPAAAENNNVVQLLWRFYYIGPSTGTRPQFGIDDITVSSLASTATPTKLAVTTITPVSPTAGAPFSVTVQSQDATNTAANVSTNTTVNLSLITGTGALGGTLTGVIASGTNSVIISANTYNVGENGVVIQAADASAGLTAGTKTLNVLPAASQLAFVGVPPSGGTNTALSSFTVEARRPDNSLDNTYIGNITISQASGPGILSGTTTVAAAAGVATFSTLQFDQSGTYTLNAAASGLTGSTSIPIVITTASSATDYFRSAVTSGDWSALSTWQSSPDNAAWQTSTLIPNENANNIYIQAGDTVIVSTAISADQVIIQSGGVLNNTTGGAFTIKDGSGDDVSILSGGVFILGSTAGPVFSGAAPVVNIAGGGILRVSRSGYTGVGAGMNLNNYVYQDGAIAEYTLASQFSASGVTFFPNVNAATVPIFRVVNDITGGVGGASPLVINGLFEAKGNVSFSGAGAKTFRNGIIGVGNVDGASGKFIINGATSNIGGTGSLILPASGLDIGNVTASTAALSSSKTITGNIALLTNSIVQLGNNNLTVTGSISGASATSYIATGTGGLTLDNIGTTPTTFPVGNGTDYTPATITNNGTVDNFTINVAAATPCDADPLQSVNRVWTISEGTPGGSVADITMQWNSTDENVSFVRGFCEAVHCSGGVVDMQGTKSTAGGSDPYTQTITGVSGFSPFGVTSALIALPISIEYLQGSKQGTSHNLVWKVNCTNAPSVAITLERSNNGRDFKSIYNITATALQCQQAFAYTDANPLAGVNYYRLKITDADGKYSYSSIVALLNAAKGLEIMNVSPNPIVNGQFKLNVTSAQQTKMDVVIRDMQGRVVSREAVNVASGFNAISMNIAKLAPGIYQLQGNTADGKTRTLNLVKQ